MLLIFGLALGSFVNALVWRLHEQAQLNKPKGKSKTKKILTREQLSISKGHSMCPHCHNTLAPRDLVPVLSWLSLRGKCRYCHKPINWQYPAVEIATATLFIASYVFWPGEGAFADLSSGINFIAWLAILTGFVALFVYDLKWMLLPNRLVYPMLLLATALAIYNIVTGDGVQSLYNTLFSAGHFGLLNK